MNCEQLCFWGLFFVDPLIEWNFETQKQSKLFPFFIQLSLARITLQQVAAKKRFTYFLKY